MSEAFSRNQRVAVIGGGPGGYEAAISAAQLGAEVVLVERSGIGGAAVLTDVVPSKTLIATAEFTTGLEQARDLGAHLGGRASTSVASSDPAGIDMDVVNKRVVTLASDTSRDMALQLEKSGVTVLVGHGRLDGAQAIVVSNEPEGPAVSRHDVDTIIISTGARPRVLPNAEPDGDRILSWTQLYSLTTLPDHLIVVGSGVTGAEFASAYRALGSKVTLVSSRDQVLPGEDADAAALVQRVFERRGMTLVMKSRAESVRVNKNGVTVTLSDGTTVDGTHALMAVGSVPNTVGIGLEQAGVELTASGHIRVNRVARSSVPNVYGVGDCSNAMPLASVAMMQGRTAAFHALGDAVEPFEARNVTSNIFTQPEIATVGWSQSDIDAGTVRGVVHTVPLSLNPRAKMQGISEGFVKLIATTTSRTVIGGVIVAPRASELIFSVALAVEHRLTVDDVARAFAVYPSMSGSIVEAARALHKVAVD